MGKTKKIKVTHEDALNILTSIRISLNHAEEMGMPMEDISALNVLFDRFTNIKILLNI